MNELELRFYNQAIHYGYTVLRRGWPDFLIVKDGNAQGVEVKSQNDFVTEEQMAMMNILADTGIDCWVYRGEWKDSDIVKRTTKDNIVDELLKYYVRRTNKIDEKITKLIESIPTPIYNKVTLKRDRTSIRSLGNRIEVKREDFENIVKTIEEIRTIIEKPMTRKSTRLIQRWNKFQSEESGEN